MQGALIEKFIKHLKYAENKSLNTLNNYEHYLKIYLIRCRNFKITLEGKLYFLEYIDKTYSNNTKRLILTVIDKFYKYLNNIEKMKIENPFLDVIKPRIDKKELITLSPKEINIIFTYLKKENNLQLIKLIYLIYYSGLRITEALNVKNNEILKNEIFIKGKGNKYRYINFHPDLKEYINKKNDDLCFVTNTKEPKSRRWANYCVKKLIYECKIDKKNIPSYFQTLVRNKLIKKRNKYFYS
ncbi:hypothetical protein ASO20_00115 [Mycoplasma sp. (ex Biomphalaria glabrata)]|uniref:tyrosine-type recombinase/integrase n=1 Tax=Mycoplasma sp. (ex Biomphalaria glabrata) TaxID=1749074 RepID=UPI00073AAFD2|nr:tyrosine-type recombinase/integrase [Mycoplasma sp. (ex Biomphalaria glabrata)]ALV23085.1 hypothetical protein ASO20_00115 [Mycoplasma sp. (ex Biomphalaria glabrata)]